MVWIGIGQSMEETNTFVRPRADVDHFRANGVEVVPPEAANSVSSCPVPVDGVLLALHGGDGPRGRSRVAWPSG